MEFGGERPLYDIDCVVFTLIFVAEFGRERPLYYIDCLHADLRRGGRPREDARLHRLCLHGDLRRG
eukprot:8296295-Heterocapsa_arctica.AAC.1